MDERKRGYMKMKELLTKSWIEQSIELIIQSSQVRF